MGFSLGSFVVRTFLIDYPNEKIDRVILMGTGQMSSIAIKIAKMMANSETKKQERKTQPKIFTILHLEHIIKYLHLIVLNMTGFVQMRKL